jgi:ABC-type Fe3+-hydroxamate transport system substrate-binding protein
VEQQAWRIGNEESLPAAHIDHWMVNLWNIEIVSGVHRVESQLTTHPVILVLLSGAGMLIRDTHAIPMRLDTVYLSPAQSTFGIVGGSGDSAIAIIRFAVFNTTSQSSAELLPDHASEPLLGIEGVSLAPSGKVSGLCRLMMEQHQSHDPLLRFRAQLTLQEMLFELWHAARKPVKADSRDALEQVKLYMEEHYGEELSIERLAGIAELSPKYFVDLFKKQYGISAMDHLTQIRMSKAKRLMIRSDMRLKDIAHEVGYEDEFYFSRKFRKAAGVSPTEFIKKRRNKLAVYGSASILGYLLPLQVVPFAAPLHQKWAGYYYSMLGTDIPVHLDAFRQNQNKAANLERLAEAKPALILCPAGIDEVDREILSELAEVYELKREATDWRATLMALAARLEEQTEAERWLQSYERKVRHVRETIEKKSVLTVRLNKNQFYAYCNIGMADLLFGSLGLTFPYPDAQFPFDRPMTLEEIDAAEADLILLLVCQETETLEGWKALQQSPQWMSMQAVRADKIRLIPSDPWREYSPSAIERMLESMPQLLTGKRP